MLAKPIPLKVLLSLLETHTKAHIYIYINILLKMTAAPALIIFL